MPADLVWTREAPTCAGWYFVRLSPNSGVVYVASVFGVDRFAIPPYGRPRLNAVFFEPGGDDAYYEMNCPEFRGAEWSGPIPLPKEAM